jgi:MFS family permease
MVAAAEYFALYYAVLRGLEPWQVAALSTIPLFFGALANAVVPFFVPAHRLKLFIAGFMFIQICGLAILVYSTTQQNYFEWILLALSLYWLGGMGGGPLWMDWMAAWLPQERFGRYYSRRSSFLSFVTLVFYIAAAGSIYWVQNLKLFFGLFAIALGARLVSWVILLIQKDPPLSKKRLLERPGAPDQWSWRHIWFLIGAAVMFKCVAFVGSPYFLPYMVSELNFNAVEIAMASASSFLGIALLMASFGEAMKKFQPITGFQMAMIMAALNCWLWTYVEGSGFAIFLQLFAGLTWAVFDLSLVLILQANFRGGTRVALGWALCLAALSSIAGSQIGSWLLSKDWQYLDLFEFSALLRFSVAALFFVVVSRSPVLRQPLSTYQAFVKTAFVMRLSFFDLFRISGVRKSGKP